MAKRAGHLPASSSQLIAEITTLGFEALLAGFVYEWNRKLGYLLTPDMS
jgi:hypothetical protein